MFLRAVIDFPARCDCCILIVDVEGKSIESEYSEGERMLLTGKDHLSVLSSSVLSLSMLEL